MVWDLVFRVEWKRENLSVGVNGHLGYGLL